MMLTSVSKMSADALDYIASFTFANKLFMNHAFPQCDSKSALIEALKKGADRWSVLLSVQPLALFTLRTSNATAIVEHFSPESSEVIPTAISGLRDHLIKRKVQEIEVNASENFAEPLSRRGTHCCVSVEAWFNRIPAAVVPCSLYQKPLYQASDEVLLNRMPGRKK